MSINGDIYNIDQSLSGIGISDLQLDSLTTSYINNISNTTLSYVDATSSIQGQLNQIKSQIGTGTIAWNYVGTFNYGSTYTIGSVVLYVVSSITNCYVALSTNTNHYPTETTYWGLITQGGQQGIQGLQGQQGVKGDKGDQAQSTIEAQASASAAAVSAVAAAGSAVVSAGAATSAAASASAAAATATAINTELATIQEEITALQGKTQFQSCNGVDTTSFLSDLNIGSIINPTRITFGRLDGNISTSGTIACNQITASSTSITNLSTTSSGTQNILGSSITIGSIGINPVNLYGMVYINGILYNPFSSSGSYFGQW
jgi:hypothetical protein